MAGADNTTILTYLRQKRNDMVVKVSRIKVMLVGPGEAGKTTLVHRLTRDSFSSTPLNRTDGVEMYDWRHGAVDFQLWDFGGQDVYFNSHALFFEARCVYLIVWNPKVVSVQDTMCILDEYFAHVLNRGSSAPIVLVSTHADEVPAMSTEMLQVVQEKYPSVVGHVHIDSKTGTAVDKLKQKLVEVALSQPHITDDIPHKYVIIETKLRELRNESRLSISQNDYEKLVASTRLDINQAALLLDLLHKWGAVHVLPGGDIVLQPQDLADVMKCVITCKTFDVNTHTSLSHKEGVLDHADISQVWSAYEPHLHTQFLTLLHNCELAFPLFDVHGIPLAQSLVPAMLPVTPHTVAEIIQLCFPDNITDSHRFVNIYLKFNVRSTTLFPKLQARLRVMATTGGAWRQAYFITLTNSLFDEQSSALLLCDPVSSNIHIVYRVGDDVACAAALRSLRELLDASFKAIHIVDIVLEVCEQSIKRHLLLSSLKKCRNALFKYVDHDGSNASVSIALLRVLFDELVVVYDHSVEAIHTVPREFRFLSILLARVQEQGSTSTDVADLSLELMKLIPHVIRHCGVSARWVQVIWLAVYSTDTGRHRLVPVSPGKSATDPWEIVQGVGIDYNTSAHHHGVAPVSSNANVQLSRFVCNCLFELGVPRLAVRVVDLSTYQDVLMQIQNAHFEKRIIAEGIEAYLQVQSGVHMMCKITEIENTIQAVHNVQMDAVFDAHRLPLLLSITQPAATGVSGWFARQFSHVYRLHFICPVCGRKAKSGNDEGDGYKLCISKKSVMKLAKCIKYTLQALEIISLVTPVPLPYLSRIADYLPSAATMAQFGLDQLHSEVQSRIDADQQLKDINLSSESIRAASQKGPVGAVEVSLEDVDWIKDVILSVGECIPPRYSGLQRVFHKQSEFAWVCKDEVCDEVQEGERGSGEPSMSCVARFRSEGMQCLSIKAAKV